MEDQLCELVTFPNYMSIVEQWVLLLFPSGCCHYHHDHEACLERENKMSAARRQYISPNAKTLDFNATWELTTSDWRLLKVQGSTSNLVSTSALCTRRTPVVHLISKGEANFIQAHCSLGADISLRHAFVEHLPLGITAGSKVWRRSRVLRCISSYRPVRTRPLFGCSRWASWRWR